MSMVAQSCVPKVNLKALLEGISDSPAIEISGISDDSRKIEPGFAFFACQGANNHGLDFIEHAGMIMGECFPLRIVILDRGIPLHSKNSRIISAEMLTISLDIQSLMHTRDGAIILIM